MRRAAALLALAVGLSGCLGPADRGPRTDPMARLQVSGPSPWSEDLGDKDLQALLQRADRGALDNRIALARVERAGADVEAATAALRPIATLGAAAAVGGRRLRDSASAATPTAEASWELDLWGRAARARQAARGEERAALDDVAAARLVTAAETARTFVALRASQDAAAEAAQREAVADRGLALALLRAKEGVATDAAVDMARRGKLAAAGDARNASDDAGLQLARLRDLAGDQTLLLEPGQLPANLPPVTGVPSDAVGSRPDVRAAFARLEAADARRASAVAAAQPKFVISAALGAPDAALATLLDIRGLAWALAGALTHEVLDGGARRAAVHAATGDADVADLSYRRTVLAAWQDVRSAVVAEAAAARRRDAARADLAAALTAQRLGEVRHREGAADGLAMANLEQAVASARAALREADVRSLEARIQRRLATGGA